MWNRYRERVPRLAPSRGPERIVSQLSEVKSSGPSPSAVPLPRLPDAKAVETKELETYNGVPFLLSLLHDPKVHGVEIQSSAVRNTGGPEPQRLPHTHEHATRLGAKQGSKTLAPLVPYEPDPTDPYVPNIDWPKSAGKVAGRDYHQARPKKVSLFTRWLQTIEAGGVPSGAAAGVSDSDDDIGPAEERVEKPRKQRIRKYRPPKWLRCNICNALLDLNEAAKHVDTVHKDLCIAAAQKATGRTPMTI